MEAVQKHEGVYTDPIYTLHWSPPPDVTMLVHLAESWIPSQPLLIWTKQNMNPPNDPWKHLPMQTSSPLLRGCTVVLVSVDLFQAELFLVQPDKRN